MPTPVKVTNEPHVGWAITGSPERVLDRAPDGTLWLQENSGTNVQLYYSQDQGATWSNSTSSLAYLNYYYPRAMHIDSDGYFHSIGRIDNTHLVYTRGSTSANGRAWKWGTPLQFNPTTEALQPGSGLDMIAYRLGTGWKVFVLYGTVAYSGGGTTFTNTLRLTRLDIAANGAASVGASWVLRTFTTSDAHGPQPYGSLSFQHTGDGKTATSTPHVYVVTSVSTTNTALHQQDDLQLVKFTYGAGIWTPAAAVTLETNVDTTPRTMRCSYDGARVVTVYGTTNRTTGITASAIHVVDWLESGGTITRHDPTAYGGGYPQGVTSAVDPASDDIYVVAYGSTVGTPTWNHFSRTGGTWAGWASVGADANGYDATGRVSLKQYVQSSAIELVYATGSASPWSVYYLKLGSVNSAPSIPALISPAPSSTADLGTLGAVFSWQFIDPDPGDTQGAWQMRRRIGAGAYSYYTSATQTWGGAAVWNTGSAQSVSFAAGVWTNGNTYSWSVNTQDSTGAASGFAPDATVTASAAPVIAITTPLGLYSLDSAPVVAWGYAGAFPQRTFQAKLFDLPTYTGGGFDPATSTPLWDSGDVSSVQARSVRVGVSLLNNNTYRIYMRVSDSNALYSGWVFGEFTLSITPAPAPSVEAVVETSYVSGVLRNRLTVQGYTNVLSADQSSDHLTGSVQWENDVNCAVSWSPNGVAVGNLRSMMLTSTANGDMRARTYAGPTPLDTTGGTPATPRDFPVTPGQTYTALASFTADATPRNVRVRLRWYDPTDTLLSTTLGIFLADQIGFPTQATVTDVAPVGADRVRLAVDVLGTAAGGEIHYVDAIDLHPGKSTTYSPGGLLGTAALTVTRWLPGDTVGSIIREVDAAQADNHQHLIAYDREMPFGTPVQYTAQIINLLTTGQTLASDPSLPSLSEVDADIWAVRDPLNRDSEANALVTDFEIDWAAQSAVYRPAGRTLPLVETEGATGDDSQSCTIFLDTVAVRRNVRELLGAGSTLLLQSPSGDQWYIQVLTQKVTAGDGQGQSNEVTYVQVDAP